MQLSAQEHLRKGDVASALQALQAQIRSEPANSELRVFLFQLLCVNGEWDRAMTQLAVAGDMDAGTLGMVQVYREALRAEALRKEVFAGRRTPLIFGDPARWIALLLEALKVGAAGNVEQGQSLRDEAFETAPESRGRINGVEFAWIADADVRLGPMLEAVVNGRYYWIPFARIAEMRIEEPEDLRDLVWTPAEFKWVNGGDAVGLIPTRYPGSELSDDPSVRLARRTEWSDQGGNIQFGLGQRMFATDADDYPLMEVRDVNLELPEGELPEGELPAGELPAGGPADG
jgi:type VI secretion system protein ImpE